MWRWLLLGCCVLCLPCLVIFLFFLARYESRSRQGAVGYDAENGPWLVWLSLKGNGLFILLTLGFAITSYNTGVLLTWAMTFIAVGPIQASGITSSALIAASLVVMSVLGSILGGQLMSRGGPADSKGRRGMVASLTAATYAMMVNGILLIPMWLSTTLTQYICFLCSAHFLQSFVIPGIYSSILSGVRPHERSWAMTFTAFFQHLLGDLLSPTLTGKLSNMFSQGCTKVNNEYDCQRAANGICRWIVPDPSESENPFCTNVNQIRNAALISTSSVFLCALFWGMALRRVKKRRGSPFQRVTKSPVI